MYRHLTALISQRSRISCGTATVLFQRAAQPQARLAARPVVRVGRDDDTAFAVQGNQRAQKRTGAARVVIAAIRRVNMIADMPEIVHAGAFPIRRRCVQLPGASRAAQSYSHTRGRIPFLFPADRAARAASQSRHRKTQHALCETASLHILYLHLRKQGSKIIGANQLRPLGHYRRTARRRAIRQRTADVPCFLQASHHTADHCVARANGGLHPNRNCRGKTWHRVPIPTMHPRRRGSRAHSARPSQAGPAPPDAHPPSSAADGSWRLAVHFGSA